MTIRNTTKRRLNVIVPPGLVAASKVAQAGGGGGGAACRASGSARWPTARVLSASSRPMRRRPACARSRRPASPAPGRSPCPAGETVDVSITGVCLNYGLPAPTRAIRSPSWTWTRIRPTRASARRSGRLSTMGTSHGVAQAVMWQLCNDLTFEPMIEQSGKIMNLSEIALAARFVEALDESTSPDLLAPSALTESRILVQVEGQGPLAREAQRLNGQLDGLRVLGLPLKVVDGETLPPCSAPAIGIRVILTDAKVGRDPRPDRGQHLGQANAWSAAGPRRPSARTRRSPSWTVPPWPAPSTGRSRGRSCRSSRRVGPWAARRSRSRTACPSPSRTSSSGPATPRRTPRCRSRPSASGPSRSALLPIQAASASLVEHVELNGL